MPTEFESLTNQAATLAVSKINNLDVADINLQELCYVRDTSQLIRSDIGALTHRYMSLKEKYIGKLGPNQSMLRKERSYELRILVDTLSDAHQASHSPGLYAPSYIEALHDYDGENQPIISLLAGADNALSIQEYAYIMRNLFPSAYPLTIDLVNAEKAQKTRKESQFAYANTLNMPFADNSLDIVMTNVLLRNLLTHSTDHSDRRDLTLAEFIDRVQTFFSESFRVLKPNGRLVMVEDLFVSNHDKINTEEFSYLLRSCLSEAGFKYTDIQNALRYQTRRQAYQHIFLDLPATTEDIETCNQYQIVAAK